MLRQVFAVFAYISAILVVLSLIPWLNDLSQNHSAIEAIFRLNIDRRPGKHFGLSPLKAALMNICLFNVLTLQHNIMSRLVVKDKMRRLVPFSWERSVFVFLATVALFCIIYFWQPLPYVLYTVPQPYDKILYAVSYIGYAAHVYSTYLLDHYELFGLKQAFLGVSADDFPHNEFKTVGFYRFVRHPIYSFVLIFFFCTPVMSAGRLLFASCALAFVLWSLPLEEGTLQAQLGEPYARYRKAVPALIPSLMPYVDKQKAAAVVTRGAKKDDGSKAE
ncbi:hypothetical protein Vretifemale_14098 [Volvox reticuliferus]|uniref:Nuclear envelope membrane protein n=1 Tax=Volvox reticuliferus TaxID=1737510 RepID=A0A8J4CS97_9CHLO|nr:hypothetical protein Vretifemale_14098 [Volvox reticuliferus]